MNPRITLKNSYDLFILECQSRRLTNHTLRFYRGRLSLFMNWCSEQGVLLLDELTHHHIRQYLVDLDENGVSSAYHHSLARAIKTFMNYCVRDEFISVSPFKKVKMPRLEKKILEPIYPEDIQRILKVCRYERDRAICLFLLDSGVRATELCMLNVGDINMDSGEVKVRVGKGQKGRVTYIGPKTRKQMRRYFIRERDDPPPVQSPLFTTQDDNSRMEYEGLKQLFRRLREEAGVHFSAHSFRRTFAIHSLRNGMNIYTLSKLMGHTDIAVLRPYLALVDVDLQQAQQQFGVVDNL